MICIDKDLRFNGIREAKAGLHLFYLSAWIIAILADTSPTSQVASLFDYISN